MPCVTQRCNQGRSQCATPLICTPGLHRVHPQERDEPLYTPEESEGWLVLFLWALVAVLAIACVAGPLYFGIY